MSVVLVIIIIAALAALGFAALNYKSIKSMDEGTERMSEIAQAIRIGADAFMKYEYKILIVVAILVAVALGVFVSWYTGVCFIIGTLMSGAAGWVGMKAATHANVRVANTARLTKKMGETLKVAFKGGSVMGLSVGGFALLGIFIVYLVFGKALGQLNIENATTLYKNWMGVEFVPFTMSLSGYALGCSVIALFNRIGGGIYTKAADMGADLVGKTEAGIPEDDPRNPATIADNVGDNVGDVAGLGSDLLESFVGSISAASILGVHLFLSNSNIGTELLEKLLYYPMIFAACGLLSCVLGIASLLSRKNLSDNPHRELNGATWVSAGLTMVIGLVLTLVLLKDVPAESFKEIGFALGAVSPWVGAALGIISGILIGFIAEYYTSYDYAPTKKVAAASKEGSALTITQGMAVGMISCMAPLIVLGVALYVSYLVGGMFGVAMAGAGMLSFVSATVSVDTYGPISDNAGGIAEMSKLDPEVREITDTLDSVGNTTAAIGKGFAIGSAAFAALSLMISFLYSFNDPTTPLQLNLMDPLTLVGALVGAALPYMFSGLLIEAVAKAARKMVDEVRRQFKEKPGILAGTDTPDYKTCIEISSKGALAEMKLPSMLAIVVPLGTGFLLGPWFVGGLLIGATVSAIMLAIFTGNVGGSWDNGKKYIESGAIEGEGKGTDAHAAAVVGDTVGDPLKDTVGPSLDILIKIMSNVSLIAVALFNKYNVLAWIESLIK
ncbi:MAG: sodium-translocating pyrophosphatase [Clostridiales bacterium]|nr:sodium-translocating pyrophosphatase [Clostridiales bacterium]